MAEKKIAVYFDLDEVDILYDQIKPSFGSRPTAVDEGPAKTRVSIPSSSQDLLISWWKEIKGEVTLFSNEAATYFHEVLNKTFSNNLFAKFSKNGASKIPSLFPNLSRIESVELARKMLDKALASRREKDYRAVAQKGNPFRMTTVKLLSILLAIFCQNFGKDIEVILMPICSHNNFVVSIRHFRQIH